MKQSEEAAYREYVTSRMDMLRRVAYLLCRDWHTADDLVSVTIGKLYRHWARVASVSGRDAYARKVLLRAWLDEKRRPWRRREELTERLPELESVAEIRVADREQLLELLDGLPPKRRAAVVLRFYCDLSVDETAEILGCTAGTVKSQTARGLDALRTRAEATAHD